MRVTEVRYDRLVSFGSHNNRRIGVTVQLDKGESPERAIGMAHHMVNQQHGRLKQADLDKDKRQEHKTPFLDDQITVASDNPVVIESIAETFDSVFPKVSKSIP